MGIGGSGQARLQKRGRILLLLRGAERSFFGLYVRWCDRQCLRLDLEQPAEVGVPCLTEMAIFSIDRSTLPIEVEQEVAFCILFETNADTGRIVAALAALGRHDLGRVDGR